MWYVIWATTGKEELTRTAIEKNIDSSLYYRLSIPHMVKYERKGGIDIRVVKRILPSYIFVETDDIVQFAYRLEYMPGFSIVLKNEGYWPLYEDEEKLLISLIKDGDLIDISRGFIEDGRVSITAGPLTGYEGVICKVNKRKRMATVEVEMFNRTMQINLGLEILEGKAQKDENITANKL